jgi:hypothetical protein
MLRKIDFGPENPVLGWDLHLNFWGDLESNTTFPETFLVVFQRRRQDSIPGFNHTCT